MTTDTFQIRTQDYSLDDEQRALQEAVRAFLARGCTIDTVRDAEPLGFDTRLWDRIADLRPVAMGVSVDRGGDGAGLVELALVVEECGRALAPIPIVEAIAAARLLARHDATDELVDGLMGHATIAVFAPLPITGATPTLIPSGAIATAVVGLHDGALMVAERDASPPLAPNRAMLPFAWWTVDGGAITTRRVLAADDARAVFDEARREWSVLTAATLVGVAQAALDLAVAYAQEREAFGVPIGSFQAIAHPLSDVATGVIGARRLVHKAAWFLDHEPANADALVPMALLHAHRTAGQAVDVGVHVHGGLGVTVESEIQHHFRRAKALCLAGGDPERTLLEIADAVYGPVGAQ